MPIRIGIIGAGAVAEYHATAARATASTALAAVCDLDEGAARHIADPAGAQVFTDYRHMFDSGAIDAVIVNTPHSLHLPMALDAAACGLHILVEKPMSTTGAACDQMITACADARVTLAVGHIQHYLPDKAAAHAALESGMLGAPILIRDYRTTDYRPGTRPDWFLSRETAGGGAIMNIGGHCLDRFLWFGGARATQLSAALASRFSVPVETDGVLALELANGVSGTITVVSDAPRKADELVIVCEGGVLIADPRNGARLQQDGKAHILSRPEEGDIPAAFRRQFEDFIHAISGQEFPVPVDHARHVVELVEAAYESDRLHSPVALDPARQVGFPNLVSQP